jgi:hypothetical protein
MHLPLGEDEFPLEVKKSKKDPLTKVGTSS